MKSGRKAEMVGAINQLAVAYQAYMAESSSSYGEIAEYSGLIQRLAELADETGELVQQLKKNGVI